MFADRRAVVGGRDGAVGRWPDLVAVALSALDLPQLDAPSAIEDLLAGDAPVAAIFERDGTLFAVTRGGCSVRLGVFVLQDGEGAHRLDPSIDPGNITIAVPEYQPEADAESDAYLLDLRSGIVRGSALTISETMSGRPEPVVTGSEATPKSPSEPGPSPSPEQAAGPLPEVVVPAEGVQRLPAPPIELASSPQPSPPLGNDPSVSGPVKAGEFEFVDLISPSEPSPRVPLSADTQTPVPSVTGTQTAGATELAPDIDDPSQVLGIVCSRDHFNNPLAAYCQVCGISMVHLTHHLVSGHRPTLGFLVFDDGATYALDRGYLIGRAPEPGPDDTQCESLTLTDEQMSVSGNHARVGLNGWDVEVTDLGSTNGSYTWDESTRQWTRMEVGVATRVDSGATLAFGRRTLIFESVVKSK